MSLQDQMRTLAHNAREAGRALSRASGDQKNTFLNALAATLRDNTAEIIAANQKDLQTARDANVDEPRINRLTLDSDTIESMAGACEHIATLSDPVGEIESMWQRPNGLLIGKMRVPLGVVMMIFESRPNVVIDASILCIKAGNAAILRGGSEAHHSNQLLGTLLGDALESASLPRAAAQVLPVTDREAVSALLKMDDMIDVVIPRGGEGLIRAVVDQATMPVLKHYKGVVHCYIDAHVDEEQAVEIVHNAKVQRPGVCNALECLLVHKDVASTVLPKVAARLGKDGVAFRACPESLHHLGLTATPAADDDYGREFHDLILAVKVVDSQTAAQEHIATYGSGHTEVICTIDHNRAMRFIREVDAAMCAINASSRFNDGGEVGLGAEIGISTSKLHAYGPMGVRELTSLKFVTFGNGQVRG